MPRKVRLALRALQKEMRANAPQVERLIARSGVRPRAAVLLSMTKYYKTLKKLAKE